MDYIIRTLWMYWVFPAPGKLQRNWLGKLWMYPQFPGRYIVVTSSMSLQCICSVPAWYTTLCPQYQEPGTRNLREVREVQECAMKDWGKRQGIGGCGTCGTAMRDVGDGSDTYWQCLRMLEANETVAGQWSPNPEMARKQARLNFWVEQTKR